MPHSILHKTIKNRSNNFDMDNRFAFIQIIHILPLKANANSYPYIKKAVSFVF